MNVLKKLGKRKGVFTGEHFVYQSKKHGDAYINFDVVFPRLWLLWQICRRLVKPYLGEFDIIVVPATGGIALGYLAGLCARLLGHKVNVVWADKGENKTFIFERATFADAVRGKRVLVIDDVMTNANPTGSVYCLCRLIEASGGVVIGVSIVCNRCEGTAEMLLVPRLEQLSEVHFTAVEAAACQLCVDRVPIVVDIGHGAEYQAEHPNYSGGYVKLLD